MFYKDAAGIIDKSDSDYNDIMRIFSYKCSLIRNHEHSKEIMEVYIPILKSKSEEKCKKLLTKL